MPVPRDGSVVAPGGAPAARPDGPAPALTRRCGRCLQQFPADPEADPVVIQELWMCQACGERLLGRRAPDAVR
jgi:hypothetical protein